AYIANTYADQVTVLDLKTLEVSGALIGGKEPDGLAWSGSAVRRKAGKAWVPFLGNATCPISGEPVRRDCYAEQLGERLYACNRDCAKKLQADFDGWRARIYPANERRVVGNAHCPCMPDRKADPKFEVAFQGYRVGLCCWKCPARFLTAPRTHLTLALHPELTRVSNRTCPVKPGVDVAPDAFVVYQDRLIAVSAGVTPEDFNRDREAALKTLDGD
ncbi:MAG: hypothetical protein KDB53_00645, partial [Planctomycetes bacterium]|nr:hypothetical protein [Planctomycetota bacterium]